MSEQQQEGKLALGGGLTESWPNLMFLGLGVWWAWIWLCFSSTCLTNFLPAQAQGHYVMLLYVFSTFGIICCLIAGSVFWRQLTPLLDKRAFTVAFGAVASVATALVCLGGLIGSPVLMCVLGLVTGVGTSALCLKAGRIYGSVSLTESLTAGSLSLLFGALLYYVGIGIPAGWAAVFISALPLCSAALLTLPWSDPFPAAVHGASERLPFGAPERVMLRRVAAAACVVAFTAGVGKGIHSQVVDSTGFAQSGAMALLFIGLIAVLLLFLISKARSAHGIRMIYTLLMVAGIVEMLSTCFGFNIFFLEVGKSALALMLWCFAAYLVFKFDFSAVRTFGIVQAVYYAGSLAGWAAGGALAPAYVASETVRTGVGVALAFLVIIVLLFVLTESHVRNIVVWSCEDASADAAQGIAVDVPVTGEFAVQEGNQLSQADEPTITDDLARVRDPKYGLSKRELEVLELFAQGRSANWIAERFVISKNTVRTHLRNIYAKLDVHTRQELLDFLTGGE